MFKHNIYNFQGISNKSDKTDLNRHVEYNYLIDFLFRLCSAIILLFSLWLISILLYYSLKNSN